VLVLFAGLVRARTAAGAAVLPLALTALVGHHAFAWTVREAFPINTFLTIVGCCALAANLSFGARRWWTDLAAVALCAVAAATVESGLLVAGIFLAGYALGLRGVSRAGIAVVAALVAGYFVLRFGVYEVGTPQLVDREAGFGFQRYSGAEIDRMFAGREAIFYIYNVVSAVMGALLAEPRDGTWHLTRAVVSGELHAPQVIGLVSSTLATALIARYAWVRRLTWRSRAFDRSDQIVLLFVLVLGANAAISYAYTKDVIMSPAGFFFAAAFFVACRDFVEGLSRPGAYARTGRAGRALGVAVVALLSVTWSIRAVGLHAGLTQSAYTIREQWAYVDDMIERKYDPIPPSVQALKTTLQNDAVTVHPGRPELRERWTTLFEMD